MEKLLHWINKFGIFYLNDIKQVRQGSKKAKNKTLIIELLPGNKGLENIGFMEFCKKRSILVQLHNNI